MRVCVCVGVVGVRAGDRVDRGGVRCSTELA